MVGIERLSISGLPLLDGVPRQGVSSVGERGHRLSERRPPFLGEEQALAVKDADPRRFRKVQIRQVERSGLLKRGWHDFSIARGCVPLLTLAGQADAQTLGGIYEVPPFFCSPCYPRVDLPVASLAAATHRTFRPRTH